MATIVTRAGKGSPLTNNEMDDNLTNLNTDKVETSVLANYALIASPTFTGDPKAPNPTFGDNDTSIATTSFVNSNAVTKTATTGGANIPVGTTAQRPTGSNGIFRYNTDLAIFEGYSGSDWGQVGGGQIAGSRNEIINGGFNINQRGYVSGAAVGTNLYGHDRWKMAASADTYTYSTTANKTTVTIPASKVLQQVVEGLNLQTGTYTLSWEGTAQGKIGAGSYGASGITGSITGGANTTIEFGPGTVANVQLELGSIATAFEQRLYGTELALCQRYCYVLSGQQPIGAGGWYSATTFLPTMQYPVPMRVAPTFTQASPVGVVDGNGANYNITAFADQLIGTSAIEWNFITATAVTNAGGSARLTSGSLTLSAEL